MNEVNPNSEFDVKIENVVVFTTLGKDIPMDKISKELVDAEYKPESFPGVVYTKVIGENINGTMNILDTQITGNTIYVQ